MTWHLDNAGRSYYVPGAFYIKFRPGALDTDGVPNANAIHTFLHEYTHLVQDQSTVFGAIGFTLLWDAVSGMRELVAHHAPTIPVPLSDQESKTEDSWFAAVVAVRGAVEPRRSWPSNRFWAFERHEVREQSVSYGGRTYHPAYVLAHFVCNETGEQLVHSIGPWEIKEAYAVAVEVLNGGPPVTDPSVGFEYLAVERIIQQLGQVEPGHVIAICHWSLQSTSPGVRLMELIGGLAEDQVHRSPAESYDFCRALTVDDGYNRLVGDIDKKTQFIRDHYAQSGKFAPLVRILDWYRQTVLTALARNLDPQQRFPLDSELCEVPEAGKIRPLPLVEHPIPVAERADGAAFAFGSVPDDTTDGMLILRSFISLLNDLWAGTDTTIACPLYRACDPSRIPFRSPDCLLNPLQHSLRKMSCPFGLVGAYLGFADPDLRIVAEP